MNYPLTFEIEKSYIYTAVNDLEALWEERMGIIRKYMNQTRRPEGVLGNLMISGMNTGHASLAKWGSGFLSVDDPASVIDLGCGG